MKESRTAASYRSTLHFFADDRVVLTVIIINTIAVFCLGFDTFRRDWITELNLIDIFCIAFYCLEAGAKIRLQSWKGYWGNAINRFDFILLIICLPAVMTSLGAPSGGALIMVLRSCRLLRFLRLLRFIPNSDHLFTGVKRALKTSLGLLLALFIYNLVLSLWSCHLFHDVAPDYFGNPFKSMYSIFKVFTVEGWFEIPDAIASHERGGPAMAAFVRLFFVGAVLTGGLLGLSLTTAIFVDEMVMDNNEPLERRVEELSEEMRSMRRLLETMALNQHLAQGERQREQESEESDPQYN